MIIETRRLQFTELNLTDVNTLADISKVMAWNDTVNILLRTDLTSQNFKECGKEDLLQYKNKIKLLAENILKEAIKTKTVKVFFMVLSQCAIIVRTGTHPFSTLSDLQKTDRYPKIIHRYSCKK